MSFSYMMDKNRYYSNNPSFVPWTVGGNTVSLFGDNMVDLESDLTGRTRAAARCACGKFIPGTVIQSTVNTNCAQSCGLYGAPCGKRGCANMYMVHLPSAQMIRQKPRPSKPFNF